MLKSGDPTAAAGRNAVPTPRAARRAYAVSAVLFAIYVVDVLAGKAAALAGGVLFFRLGDVGQFLVVLAMAVAFVAGLMCSEGADGE